MGMFDTYHIDCPHCFWVVEDQSKPGMMKDFYFGKDPKTDMQFAGFYRCYHCDKAFTVEFETIPKMVIRKCED